MDRDDLIWELSARLERLQAATPAPVSELADLRCRFETSPVTRLDTEITAALALADRVCCDSLSAGDIAAFVRQAPVCAGLRLFGVCARLIDDG